MTTKTLIPAAGLALTASASLIAFAPSAGAAPSPSTAVSTASVSHTIEVDFTAGAGQANDLAASYLGTATVDGALVQRFALSDNHPISAGDGCVTTSAPTGRYRVVCTVAVPNPDDISGFVIANLGDGNDRATTTLGSAAGSVYGGTGDDRIALHNNGSVYGEAGNDRLSGGSLDDGGDGNDTITGVRYDNAANETTILGGRGDDVIRGSLTKANIITGNSGRDTIRGGNGNDQLLGGPDDDVVSGGAGNDGVYGGPGLDRLSGGTGTNTVRQDGAPQQGDQPNP